MCESETRGAYKVQGGKSTWEGEEGYRTRVCVGCPDDLHLSPFFLVRPTQATLSLRRIKAKALFGIGGDSPFLSDRSVGGVVA